MKIIIIDDEMPVLTLLKRVLESFENVEIVGEYTNSINGLQAIYQLKPDVCFLDIEMPELNGIQIAEELINQNIEVVFVTAYTQYAVEAFKVNAVDYILKPITKDEVTRVLGKLRKRIEPRQQTKDVAVHFFGELQVSYKEKELEWPTEKTAELFAYLLYYAGTKVEKWKLCDVLWPHVEPEKAMHNVYNAMYRLKKLLDTHQISYNISNKRGFYEFTLENAMVDFFKMNQLLQQFSEVDATSLHEIEQMEALYQGEFLVGKDYRWCQPIRTYYEQGYNRIAKSLLDYYVKHDLDDKAIALGRKVLQFYPEQEHIAQLLMPLYLKKGKPALQKFYKEYENHFTRELHSTLSEQTIQVYERMIC